MSENYAPLPPPPSRVGFITATPRYNPGREEFWTPVPRSEPSHGSDVRREEFLVERDEAEAALGSGVALTPEDMLYMADYYEQYRPLERRELGRQPIARPLPSNRRKPPELVPNSTRQSIWEDRSSSNERKSKETSSKAVAPTTPLAANVNNATRTAPLPR